MHTLVEGNHRFLTNIHPGMAAHFDALTQGQAPHTLMVTCSDSRIDPALITQSLPGDVFMLRNVGNLVPPLGQDESSAAVIEYAVSALGVRSIVVCGHSGCGAMAGLLTPGALEALPAVERWVEHAAPTRAAAGGANGEVDMDDAIRHNARTQLDNLMTLPSVASGVAEGSLSLKAWVYQIGTGRIEVVDTRGGQA